MNEVIERRKRSRTRRSSFKSVTTRCPVAYYGLPSHGAHTWTRMLAPSQWPSQLQYIHSSRYHSSVSAAVRLEIEGGPSNHSYVPQHHRRLVVIRSISCPSHPAHGQSGLFAVRKIPPNTQILDYIGIHT
jgi:hypothetical protein